MRGTRKYLVFPSRGLRGSETIHPTPSHYSLHFYSFLLSSSHSVTLLFTSFLSISLLNLHFSPLPSTSFHSSLPSYPPLHFTTPPTPGGLKSETLNFKKFFHKISIIPYNYIDLSEKSQNSVIRKLKKMTSMKTPSICARVNIKRRELYRKYVLNSPFAK